MSQVIDFTALHPDAGLRLALSRVIGEGTYGVVYSARTTESKIFSLHSHSSCCTM